MTVTLEGGEWSAARPGRTLPPGKTRYPLYRRLGGPQGRSGRAENLVLTGIRSRIVQPVVSTSVKYRCYFVGVKRLGRETDLLLSVNRFKNIWSYDANHPACLHAVLGDKFTFFLSASTSSHFHLHCNNLGSRKIKFLVKVVPLSAM